MNGAESDQECDESMEPAIQIRPCANIADGNTHSDENAAGHYYSLCVSRIPRNVQLRISGGCDHH